MAHSLSAKKRIRQNAKHRTLNRARKSVLKTSTKRFLTVIDDSNIEKAQAEYKLLVKKLDQAASTSTMHKNTASRIKSRLAKRLNSLKAKGSSAA
ncbi:MAG: 30S ribosomal protein S20 [Planctomycetes bacterium]|nr:30S ribosomal protein S20 [Planctomycetota bacterium]